MKVTPSVKGESSISPGKDIKENNLSKTIHKTYEIPAHQVIVLTN